jgi:diphosphomevalonate decarboxylase
MSEENFKANNFINLPDIRSYTWSSPSNIALIKYWGKNKNQTPKNTSISFTLSNSRTITTLELNKKNKADNNILFDVYYKNKKIEEFRPKIDLFFRNILEHCSYLKEYSFKIITANTFPHSSGIASSASGMSALALCVMSLERDLDSTMKEEYFYKKASFLSRIGSGSACRSILGGINLWGKHTEVEKSTDLYSIKYPYEICKDFLDYNDTILLVDTEAKQVSSSDGHKLMNNHIYADKRYKTAQKNVIRLKSILKNGNLNSFTSLIEEEAMMLHALMMTSNPSYVLIKPNTLKIINSIKNYREITKIPICFTLDAGANVHVLYPKEGEKEVESFIESELKKYCKNHLYIKDKVGIGSIQL